MCRLFGFRSTTPNTVHDSLLTEKNSLRFQSQEHKDGWGIAYYLDQPEPQVAHGLGAAYEDMEYARVSEFVRSAAVVAHVRLASVGGVTLENAHPFTWRRWSFAHNGTLRNFAAHKAELEARIAPRWFPLLRGETDSERCFYVFLTRLEASAKDFERPTIEEVSRALAWSAHFATTTCVPGPTEKPSSANFLISDGELMACTRIQRTLFFSERKRRSAGPAEPPVNGARLHQIVIASEQLSGEDHWHEVPENSVVAVDRDLTLRRWSFEELGV